MADDSASDMDDVATYWDDEEKIAYGREKVFSYTGYQLQLQSLIGILYASARILHLDLLPRDFQLYRSFSLLFPSSLQDGDIPFINLLSFLSSSDR